MVLSYVFAAADDSNDCSNWLTCTVKGVGDAIGGAASAAKNAASAAGGVVDFWSDPWGNTFKALQTSAKSLAEQGLNALTDATLPDLNAQWWLHSYAVSFALAVFVMILVLIPAIVRTARGSMGGRELTEMLGVYTPLFLVGAMFGPALGIFIVKVVSALTDSITGWGLIGSTGEIVKQFNDLIEGANASKIAGGAVVGVIIMGLMILGLLLVMLALIVQLITLYFLGAVMPLGFVWVIDPQRRQFGMKIIFAWLGILLSHPLIFLMLGITYSMVGSSLSVFSQQPSLQSTVQLIVDMLALFLVAFSPLFFARLAPVIPAGGTGNLPTSGSTIGPRSLHEADNSVDTPSTSTPSAPSSSPSVQDAGGDSAPAPSSSPAPAGATSLSGAGEGTGTAGAGAAGAEGAAAGASGAGAAAGGAGVAAAGGELAAAGGATAATGGAAAPVAAAALGAKALYDKAKTTNDGIKDTAESPLRDHDERYGKDSLND